MTPLLPFINDSEENIKEIVRLTAINGGQFVYSMFGVTLRDNQRDYYYNKLDDYFPGIKEKMIKRYGDSYSCFIPDYKQKIKVFEAECRKHGLLYKMEDIIETYKTQKEDYSQLTLF